MNLKVKLFSPADIERIDRDYVRNKGPEYYIKAHNRWETASAEFKTKFASWDFPRPASLFDYEDWIEKYNLKNVDKLLITSPTDHEVSYITAKSTTEIRYELDQNTVVPEYDLHIFNVEEKNHDFAILTQTFEHLFNPFVCMKNIYDHLKPGGYFYASVPIINIPHSLPNHFWGITPVGFCMLGESAGFTVKECGFWGNKKYVNYLMQHNWWPGADDVRNENGIIENVYHQQAQTWILLQK